MSGNLLANLSVKIVKAQARAFTDHAKSVLGRKAAHGNGRARKHVIRLIMDKGVNVRIGEPEG
jgi:hypothetical protein